MKKEDLIELGNAGVGKTLMNEMDNANKDMIKPMLDAKRGLENMVKDLFARSPKITRDCPHCNSKDEVQTYVGPTYFQWNWFSTYCGGCYDAEYVGGWISNSFVAGGKSEEESIQRWNEHET